MEQRSIPLGAMQQGVMSLQFFKEADFCLPFKGCEKENIEKNFLKTIDYYKKLFLFLFIKYTN